MKYILQDLNPRSKILIHYKKIEILNEDLRISSPLPAKNAYAIVIGISDYPGSSNDLSYCDDDAQDIYSMLINDYNFKTENVIYLQDSSASKNAINTAFDQISSQITNDDIFFSIIRDMEVQTL